jgi:hypothetical protein
MEPWLMGLPPERVLEKQGLLRKIRYYNKRKRCWWVRGGWDRQGDAMVFTG